MARNSLTLVACGILLVGLSTAFAARAAAQEMAPNLGYGLDPGDAVIVLVPEEVAMSAQQRGRIIEGHLEVTDAEGVATPVGNCERGDVMMQQAQVVSRDGAVTQTRVGLLYPDDAMLPVGAVLDAWRTGSPCGDGFMILRGHLVVSDY